MDFVRRRTGERSVGHAGTLDPAATGLLILMIGSATKTANQFSGLDKDYRGTLLLGCSSDTGDLEGRIGEEECPVFSEESLKGVFSSLEGPQLQEPPRYSAVHKNGRRLYQWAREGVLVQAPPRPITIHAFRLETVRPPELEFFLSCSKGTYVRALVEELGRKLGVAACLSSLMRTRIGPFAAESAFREDDLRRMPREEIASRLLTPQVLV